VWDDSVRDGKKIHFHVRPEITCLYVVDNPTLVPKAEVEGGECRIISSH